MILKNLFSKINFIATTKFVYRDGDGVIDALDNCEKLPNPSQSDYNNNGIGDLCDPDIDSDGVTNDLDYCPYFANSSATNGW